MAISPRKTAPSRRESTPGAMVCCEVLLAISSPTPRAAAKSSKHCLPSDPQRLSRPPMWSSFCLLCVILFTHPFQLPRQRDATWVGPQAQSAWSLLRQWWFSGSSGPGAGRAGHTGYRGRADWGGSDPNGRGGASLLAGSQGASLPLEPQETQPWQVASRYEADGSATGNSLFPSWVSVGPGTAGL